MTTQWGAPLTGEQMKLLRAAGLPDDTTLQFMGWDMYADDCQFDDDKSYRLPADHAAYTLLEAGWLDGRNVALWFGGESWPNSWLEGSDIIRRDGTVEEGDHLECWRHNGDERDIIAYIRKAEGLTTHADRVLADAERMAKRMGGKFVKNELWNDVVAASGEAAKADACAGCHGLNTSCPDGCFDEQTVTIAKMTEAEVSEVALSHRMTTEEVCGAIKFCRLMGLIREPTRLERFWATRDTKDVYGPPCKAFQLIEEALNFERD